MSSQSLQTLQPEDDIGQKRMVKCYVEIHVWIRIFCVPDTGRPVLDIDTKPVTFTI